MANEELLQMLRERIAQGLTRKSVQSCSKWAEQYRIMGDSFPGPWTFDHHPWLREMHDCKAELMIGQKCAQVGFTETGLNKAFFAIDISGISVLYVLPTSHEAGEFSSSRFDPALEASEHLRRMFSNVKNVSLKRSGLQCLFIRGSRSRSQLKSLPVGLVILDETDEMTEENIALAFERMSGQLVGQAFLLSTPTVEDHGINAYFKQSTQSHFFFPCPSCGRRTELLFPECLVITAENWTDPKVDNSYLVCKECKNTLPHEAKSSFLKHGVWVPQYENRTAVGFHVNQLYSATVTPGKMAKAFLKAKTNPADEQEFYNSKLGIVHEVDGAKVTLEEINKCISGNIRKLEEAPANSYVTMGVDVGHKYLHCEIDQWFIGAGATNDVNINSQCRVLNELKVQEFEQLDALMRKYQVNFCVIDANPERRKALEFARRFWGMVKLCLYNVGISSRVITVKDEESHLVGVDRTAWMDLALARYRTGRVALPLDTSLEYKNQIQAPVRIYKKDKHGNPVGMYVKKGSSEDHFAHARTYAELALTLSAANAGSHFISGVL
jgi:hypothetical protein